MYLYIYMYINVYQHMYIDIYQQLVLGHTATHCNTLQHTATHCNTYQHLVLGRAQLKPIHIYIYIPL